MTADIRLMLSIFILESPIVCLFSSLFLVRTVFFQYSPFGVQAMGCLCDV